ncbi:MAG: response regulator [Verrucomicrobia bacterium]|nr:response regulator [Verrucomicrobiota bacterium]
MNADQIRILVVDDDADVARGTAHLLENAGYVTATAANGVAALDTLATFHPQLVLSDRDMPAMDGMELCRRIKGDPALSDVLVVLVSGTYTESEQQSDGFDSGADGYIARPIANRELAARVKAFARIIHLNNLLRQQADTLQAINDELRQSRAAALNLMRDAIAASEQLQNEITERKQAEAAVQAKNQELEQFTYAVSHDLRSPLVTIQTFLGHLEEDIRDQNSAHMAKDLGYLHAAADQMGRLLEELLELSRVDHQPSPPEDVALSVVVTEALALAAGRISQRGVQVVVTATPAVLHGNRARLVAVFQNLVDNACKFMGDQKEPRIAIGMETRGTEPVFFVRDNGGGIAPGQQKKLFGLFVRLNPQVEGTGLGLALVKRIIELHGGRIWVESPGVGQGACFYFTLSGAVNRPNEGAKS